MDAPAVDETTQMQAEQSPGTEPRAPATPEAQVTVEHRSRLAAALGLAAAVVTVAWFSRALQTGHLVDWLVCAGLGLVGAVQLAVLRDSRAPLLVADDQGVRVRHGVTWTGLRWQDIDHVELDGLPSSSEDRREVPFAWLLGDRRIVVHPRREAEGDEVEGGSETFAIPLTATTRLATSGMTGDLADDLDLLASGRAPVVVLSRRAQSGEQGERVEAAESTHGSGPEDHDETSESAAVYAETEGFQETSAPPLPAEPGAASEDTDAVDEADESVDSVESVVALEDPRVAEELEPVTPARPATRAVRAEVVRETVRVVASGAAVPAQRSFEQANAAQVQDLGPIGEPETFRTRPAVDPVIGPMIAAARNRARLSIDELSERTRIRPHVLESIEVDDFEPCGGDFYARGHLRTLARIFGLDAQELLGLYDERYAHAEIGARQVFEAELATGIGGGVRAAASGPRWSLLAAAVIVLGLVWGGTRVFTPTPRELVSPAPEVVDSAGLASGRQAQPPKTTLAPLSFTAAGASPQVVVRDRTGRILWAGQLSEGQHQQIIGQAPFDVTASNGAAVKVSYLGKPHGTVGSTSAPDNRKFG